MSQKKHKIPRNVIALGIVSLFTDISTEMIYPLLPLFISTLGSGAVMLGIIEGLAETTASMLKLASGVISDKVGKRKFLVVAGYAISSIIRPFTGIVSAAWQIVLIRTTDRIGKGIRTSPRDALIASSVDESIRGKAYGFHRSMDHLGATLGPLVSILIVTILIFWFDLIDISSLLRTVFIISLLPGLLAVLTLIFFVQDKTDGIKKGGSFSLSYKNFDANFWRYLLSITIFTLGNSSDAFMLFRIQESFQQSGVLLSIVSGIPLIESMMQKLGDTGTQTGFLSILFLPFIWSFFHIVKVIFSTPFGALSDRIGRKKVINIGWGIYVFVYIGFAFLDILPGSMQILGSFILFTIYAMYYAFTEGAEKAFVADIVSPELRGSAFGLYNFSIGIAALPASIIFGFVYYELGGTTAFGIGAGIAVIAMIALNFLVKED
ncbi:MAG: MFS transporter [Ignavibacteriales bacterium]|nr:MFS transporter [Ignavibacteriales bacterium]MCF8305187.1 MFS transporter [Ignavibacteriales bacterium]MCF8314900.1 MFS transporter [Ignavibacteriales bacterium]MCF8436151.1 MFS transporter [Ignavibacteriales bacterium]